jgi:hypothetical protein
MTRNDKIHTALTDVFFRSNPSPHAMANAVIEATGCEVGPEQLSIITRTINSVINATDPVNFSVMVKKVAELLPTEANEQQVDCREAFNARWPAAKGMDLTTPENHAELHLIWVGFEAAWNARTDSDPVKELVSLRAEAMKMAERENVNWVCLNYVGREEYESAVKAILDAAGVKYVD